MTSINSAGQALAWVMFQPQAVFRRLAEVKYWSWWPCLLQISLLSICSAYYFSEVDWAWYQQEQLLPQLQGLSPQEQIAALDFSPPSMFIWSSLFGAVVGLPMMMAIYAFYLSKLTQLDEDNIHSFGDWYGLNWWCTLPNIVPSLLGLLMITIAPAELDPLAALAPLSLSNVLSWAPNHAWYQWGSSLSLVTPCIAWLQYQGVRNWTQINAATTGLIVALPYAVIYGGWALLITFF